MTQRIRIASALSLFLSLAAFAVPFATQAAFGISPPFLNADHLVKGATYSQTIYLVQDQPNQDLRVKADLKISDAVRSWVSIDKGTDFVIPAGTRQFPVVIKISVPNDAALGIYSGSVSFTGVPGQTGQVTIALGAQVAINLSVGEGQYRNFSIPLIRFLDIEEGWSPRADIKFQNDGNIPEAIDGATFELFDQYDSVRLAYIQKSDGFPEIAPFSKQEATLEFPTDFHLGTGQYWGSVTLYQGQKVVKAEKTVFNVVKAGSLSSPAAVFLENLQAKGIFYGAAALIILGAAIVWKKRRVRKS